MIGGLQRFFDALRESGVRTSPAERLDALRAIEELGLENRATFRRALEATLVKHAGQRAVFGEVFERFFAAPARGAGPRRGVAGAGGPSGRVGRAAEETQAVRGPRPPRPEPERSAAPPSARRADERRDDVRGAADRLRRELAAVREGRRERWGRLRRVVPGRAAREPDRPATRDVAEVELRELRRRPDAERRHELAREVRRLVERIRMRAGRRLRRRPTGRPYLRRVFRESLASGGVPFRIPRRRRRLRTPRVTLLIDVSWSTATAAGLFLEMACEFLRLGRQTRVILFVDRPVEATERIAAWRERGRGRPFDELLRSIPGLNLDAPSDYGRLFHSLAVSPRRPRGRRTLLVVLGDGRTNVFDPLDWALSDLTEGCGAALWLVPEPIGMWGAGDSALPRYLPHVDTVVEAGDLAGLARGVAELVRRL